MIYLFLAIIFSVLNSLANPVLPTEIVEGSPVDFFSERSQIWPTEKISTDYLISDKSLFDNLGSFSHINSRSELSAGNPHISIRGSQSYARTLMVYNGTPLNLLDGTGANPLLLANETVHKIMVLKGPSSVLYGSDAVGGALQLVPYRYTSPLIRAGAGSFGRQSLYLASPLIQNSDHHLQMTGFLNSLDGNFDYLENGERKKRSFNNSHLQRITISGENKFSGYTVRPTLIYGQSFGATPGPIDAPYVTLYNRTALLGSFTVDKNINAKNKIHYRGSYIRNEDFNTDLVLNQKTRWFASQFSDTLSLKTQFSPELSADFFADFYYNEFDNKPNTTKLLTESRTEPGVILKYIPDSDFYISPGARYLPDSGLLIKSLIVGQIINSHNVWISYSEGFRNPSFSQLYYQSSLFVGNPNLKSEKSSQIELGLSKNLDQLSYEISTYSTDYSDFIEYVGGSPGTYINSGNVDIFGVETSVGIQTKYISLDLNYAYSDGSNNTSGLPVLLLPRNKFSYTAGTQVGPIIAELTHTHWGKHYLTTNMTSGSWDVFDFTVRTLGLSNWVFKFSVQNIFNNRRQFTVNYPEPGRQYLLNVERAL